MRYARRTSPKYYDIMPDGHTLWLLVVASIALALTPGPDVIYIVSRSTGEGRTAGLIAALGVRVLLLHSDEPPQRLEPLASRTAFCQGALTNIFNPL